MRSNPSSLLDQLINGVDQTLRQLHDVAQPAVGIALDNNEQRLSPTHSTDASVDDAQLDERQRLLAARLMRVNHAGEVAAQALYQGQALASQNAQVRSAMQEAAAEENDHLVWCKARLTELDCRPSVLNPLWYTGSFAIGYIAGKAGDDWSLGFVGETERQVVAHLEGHLEKLPAADHRSRRIVQTMKEDEARHGQTAMDAGGRELPPWIRSLMSLTSRLMTRSSFWM